MELLGPITQEFIFEQIAQGNRIYQEIYDLPIITSLKSAKGRKEFFSDLPLPVSFTPGFWVGNEILNVEEAAFCKSKSLDDLIEITETRHNYFGYEDIRLLRKAHLINMAVFTQLDDRLDLFYGLPKLRKHEEIPSFVHSWKVELLLPEDAPLWAHILALSHDTIEDSHRHRLLKKWLRNNELSQSEKEFLQARYQGKLFEGELPKEVSRSDYNLGVQEIRKTYETLLNIKEDNRMRVTDGLTLLTKKAYVRYKDYLKELANTSDNELAYWLMMIKMNDRWDNSHFNASLGYDNTEKIDLFEKNGSKLLKDSLKNIYLLDASKELYLRLKANNTLSEDEHKTEELYFLPYLRRTYSLAYLTNKNMNILMSKIKELFGEKKLTLNNSSSDLTHWFEEMEIRLHDYYENGGFIRKDNEPGDPNELFNFRGSMELLDKFLEEDKSYDLFGSLKDSEQILRLYKYAATLKVFSCLYLSHNPFVNGRLVIEAEEEFDNFGQYDESLKDYHLSNFLTK